MSRGLGQTQVDVLTALVQAGTSKPVPRAALVLHVAEMAERRTNGHEPERWPEDGGIAATLIIGGILIKRAAKETVQRAIRTLEARGLVDVYPTPRRWVYEDEEHKPGMGGKRIVIADYVQITDAGIRELGRLLGRSSLPG